MMNFLDFPKARSGPIGSGPERIFGLPGKIQLPGLQSSKSFISVGQTSNRASVLGRSHTTRTKLAASSGNVLGPRKPLGLPQIARTYSESSIRGEAKVVSKELEDILQRLRVRTDAIPVALEDDMRSVTTYDLSERFMKFNENNAKLHMMKVRMRMQESDMEKVTKEATTNLEETVKISTEISQVAKNMKNLKAFESNQEKEIQTNLKQTSECHSKIEYLKKEIGRIKRELEAKTKDGEAEAAKVHFESSSVTRMATQNDKLKAEIQELKDEGKSLQEAANKQQQQHHDAKKRHQQQIKRFNNLIQKRRLFLDLLKTQRDHVENSKVFQFSSEEFRSIFRPESGTSGKSYSS